MWDNLAMLALAMVVVHRLVLSFHNLPATMLALYDRADASDAGSVADDASSIYRAMKLSGGRLARGMAPEKNQVSFGQSSGRRRQRL